MRVLRWVLIRNDWMLAREVGVICDDRWAEFQRTKSTMERAVELLESCVLSPQVRLDLSLWFWMPTAD